MLVLKTAAWNPERFPEIGRGGEAVVYEMRRDLAAKVFLSPGAPELANNPQLQEAARVRIAEMQYKLFDFPHELPKGLIAPTAVLVDGSGKVFGYAMPFVQGVQLEQLGRTTGLLQPSFALRLLARLCGWFGKQPRFAERVIARLYQLAGKERLSATAKLLLGLYDLVAGLHAKGVVIGDFNENNVLVAEDMTPYLIDADSMQFGLYQCKSFMPRFVAPELLKFTPSAPQGDQFAMVAPHNELTDWYSFLVIAMRLMTFTEPYGGVADGIDLGRRLTERITIFDPRVIYPMVARPLREVPRPILEVFFRVFHKGERFIPNREMFRAV